MSVTSFVARVGSNPTWIAANAHFWFAFSLVQLSHGVGTVAVIAAVAAVKEFVFDRLYEHDPPQTTLDNVEDFFGYLLGALASYLV